jgi:predicted DNA-binding transcriptional regulator YafY
VEELRAGGQTSARQLATTLGVGLRTIERDIAELVGAGLPIMTERGRYGGYWLAAAAAPKPVRFTIAEAAAIAVALTSVGPYSSACNQSALDKVLDAIRAPCLTKTHRARIGGLGHYPMSCRSRQIAAVVG